MSDSDGMTKRRAQVVPPGGAVVGLDGVRWEGTMLITARCGHQFTSESRPNVDICISAERLLNYHERLCTGDVQVLFSVLTPQPAQRVTALEM